MKIGIDFGTSYSAAAFASGGQVRKIKFGSDTQFRTAVYFPETIPTFNDFEMSPQLQKMADDLLRLAKSDQSRSINEAQSRIADAMREKDSLKRSKRLELIAVPRERSDDELRKDIVRTVRQQWLEDETRRARSSVAQSANAVFGDEAIETYLAEGTGHLIQSPKSMLGFDFNAHARSTVVDITANILEHIRSMATRQLKLPVRQAVVGRPVQFRSSLGDKGNEQAVALLQEAAAAAGFDAIEFMEEPIAAAIGFHRKSPDRVRALILDVGGGTTDVAYAELGGSRRPKILSSWGLPKGGSDVDVGLSLESFTLCDEAGSPGTAGAVLAQQRNMAGARRALTRPVGDFLHAIRKARTQLRDARRSRRRRPTGKLGSVPKVNALHLKGKPLSRDFGTLYCRLRTDARPASYAATSADSMAHIGTSWKSSASRWRRSSVST